MGIVEQRKIWVSDIRYLNDAAELGHIGSWLDAEISKRIEKLSPQTNVLLQFRDWFRDRLTHGHMVFVGCFTENGNLLSQWRGYCPHGRGVSIGFESSKLVASAQKHSFSFGRCVYDKETKSALASEIIDSVTSLARRTEEPPPSKRHPTQSYHEVFEVIEPELLKIAALVKDFAFHEEMEWRIVSPVLSNYVEPQIKYREGPTMLIPYLELPLAGPGDRVEFEQVVIGPTPAMNLSMASISRYISKYAICRKTVNC
jgi:hypothetical protein